MKNIGIGEDAPTHFIEFKHNGKTAYFDITKEGKCIFEGDIDPKTCVKLYKQYVQQEIKSN